MGDAYTTDKDGSVPANTPRYDDLPPRIPAIINDVMFNRPGPSSRVSVLISDTDNDFKCPTEDNESFDLIGFLVGDGESSTDKGLASTWSRGLTPIPDAPEPVEMTVDFVPLFSANTKLSHFAAHQQNPHYEAKDKGLYHIKSGEGILQLNVTIKSKKLFNEFTSWWKWNLS